MKPFPNLTRLLVTLLFGCTLPWSQKALAALDQRRGLPSAVADLRTRDGLATVRGQWRYSVRRSTKWSTGTSGLI